MNRYTILSLVLIASVALLIVFSPEDDSVEITGYAENIHEGQNGRIPDDKDICCLSPTAFAA